VLEGLTFGLSNDNFIYQICNLRSEIPSASEDKPIAGSLQGGKYPHDAALPKPGGFVGFNETTICRYDH